MRETGNFAANYVDISEHYRVDTIDIRMNIQQTF